MTKQKLEIARAPGDTGRFILNPDSLNKIVQLVGNQVKTLMYLQSSLNEKTGKAEEFTDLRVAVNKLVENALFQVKRLVQLDPWSGAAGLVDKLRAYFSATEFGAFQEFIAATSARNIAAEEITLDYAVGKSSQFMRAYTSEGNMLTGEALDAMDTLFNAWLAKNNMISEGGVIYEGLNTGEIKKVDGVNVRVNPEKLLALLNGDGFQMYVQKTTSKVNHIITRQNEYEESTPSAPS